MSDDQTPDAQRLSPEQDAALRDAIRCAIETVPGHYVGPLMKPLMDEIAPVVLGFLGVAPVEQPVADGGETSAETTPTPEPGPLPIPTGLEQAIANDDAAAFVEALSTLFGAVNEMAPAGPLIVDEAWEPYPERPAYEPPADLVGGPGTTEPFAVILTDPGDWPYNNAFVLDDVAVLHRIENDRSMPADEVLMEAVGDAPALPITANSEADWWRQVTPAIAAIPENRRFEGIYY